MFNSLRPHGLKHTRLPCLSRFTYACSDSCQLSQWFNLTISSSAVPFSFCLQSFTLYKPFQKFSDEGILSTSCYEATITLIAKSDKDITEKENYRPISLVNIHTKILNEILGNRIQQHIKRIIHHDQMGFIPGKQGFFNICKINVILHLDKLKNKNHIITSMMQKIFWQNSIPIYNKKISRKWAQWEYTSKSQRPYMTNPQQTLFSVMKN